MTTIQGRTRARRRAPRSLRKHLRRQKALLRRTLPPAEAAKAIARLTRGARGRTDTAAGEKGN